MRRGLFLSLAFSAALTVSGAMAQEPPTPIGLTLTQTGPGAYRLEVRPAAPAPPYGVSALVSMIGSDHGVVVALGESDGAPMTISLPLPLDGMSRAGCYRVGIAVSITPAAKPEPTASGLGLDTPACLDVSGVVTFPAFDGISTPPPTVHSDVRMVRVPGIAGESDTWRIEWTDNSADEIAFDPGVILLDKPRAEGGSAIAGIDIPQVQANQTSAGSIGFFFVPDGPPNRVCGSALVLVFAVGPDSPSIWPGNTTVPACFGTGFISFPDAGGGVDANAIARDRLALAFVLCTLGAATLVFGAVMKRRGG
jgi:hypothetical protein